jgi:hypothetical protein
MGDGHSFKSSSLGGKILTLIQVGIQISPPETISYRGSNQVIYTLTRVLFTG